jgi:prophage maintenance system killer protein
LRRPGLELAVAINRLARQEDEWFDEPDELERLRLALDAVGGIDDPITAAAVMAYRVARAQAFGEANKRTAFLLAKWILDRNGQDGAALLPPEDREFAALLVRAASGLDVEDEMVNQWMAQPIAHLPSTPGRFSKHGNPVIRPGFQHRMKTTRIQNGSPVY